MKLNIKIIIQNQKSKAMRFKIKKADKPKHTELVACVGWTNISENGGELYSVGDDQAIWKWDVNGEPVSIQSIFYLFIF